MHSFMRDYFFCFIQSHKVCIPFCFSNLLLIFFLFYPFFSSLHSFGLCWSLRLAIKCKINNQKLLQTIVNLLPKQQSDDLKSWSTHEQIFHSMDHTFLNEHVWPPFRARRPFFVLILPTPYLNKLLFFKIRVVEANFVFIFAFLIIRWLRNGFSSTTRHGLTNCVWNCRQHTHIHTPLKMMTFSSDFCQNKMALATISMSIDPISENAGLWLQQDIICSCASFFTL